MTMQDYAGRTICSKCGRTGGCKCWTVPKDKPMDEVRERIENCRFCGKCQGCGYTEEDKSIHLDHHLCNYKAESNKAFNLAVNDLVDQESRKRSVAALKRAERVFHADKDRVVFAAWLSQEIARLQQGKGTE